MTRTETLLGGLARDARVIEIGPSFAPLAPKQEGWNTFVVDHASREELRTKYRDSGKDIELIEEVDYVWQGGSLVDALPVEQHGTFDAFIASHVIEHTTDVVTFLRAAQALLKPDGVVILAVPDKRKCFDFYRHPSTTADAIIACEERRDRHNTRTHLEYAMRMVQKAGNPAWHQDDTTEPRLMVGLDEVPRLLEIERHPGYADAHNWVFVPASFRLMILELGVLGYLDLRVEGLGEAPTTEFHAWLRPGHEQLAGEELEARRRALMNQALIEIAEQTRQIVGSPLQRPPALPEPPAPPAPPPPRRWLFGRRST